LYGVRRFDHVCFQADLTMLQNKKYNILLYEN